MKNKDFSIKFWGVRGSIPTPGKNFKKYGGNTPCVEVRCGETILIFDAGTGIRDLGISYAKEFQDRPHEINLFISHTHWDHIQGFPFFSYIYMKSKTINIYGGHYYIDLKTLLSGQMKKEYFPVQLENLPSNLKYSDITTENSIAIGDISVFHTYLLHPAMSLGYRVEYKNKVFVYATDNELIKNIEMPDFNMQNLDLLIKNADMLVAECQYSDREYPAKVGWGHSTIEGVVGIAKKFGVRRLYAFHHDPYHTDADIDKMILEGKNLAGKTLKIFGAREGQTVYI